MNQESGLVLVRLDQSELEVGSGDLERDARESSAGADVHHLPRLAEVVDENQTVFDQGGVGSRHEAGPRRDQFC